MKAKRIPLGDAMQGILEAAKLLNAGKLVAFPTDTVYGLGAHIGLPEAVRALYTAKGRPENRPIPVLVASVEDARKLAKTVPKRAEKLFEAFFPGPLTVVLPAVDWIPSEVTAGTGSIGVRMPNCQTALELIKLCGGALAVTSANLSGRAEAITADEVLQQIGDRIDAVLDGGKCAGGVPSTVVDLTVDPPALLRKGALSSDHVMRLLSE
ncbi:MAG: L-threonylcarbamoyladenylate synthase [Armatimonadota bacterium]